jgi:hypothetical protein
MKVICIENIIDGTIKFNLTVNKCYEVSHPNSNLSKGQYLIENDNGDSCFYNEHIFIGIKEYRKLKIQKINESNMR